MADTERPKFIKPDEQSTLVGYPTPGEIARNTVLEGQLERDQAAVIGESIRTGKLRPGEVHEMLRDSIKRRNNRHQDPSGLKR